MLHQPIIVLAAACTAALASPSAEAAGPNWDTLAQCESSGNWAANTGNGYYGGIQFAASTWQAYGGTQYAARADLASKSQQIAIGQRVLASQGPGAWPSCTRTTGWNNGARASRRMATPTPTPKTTPVPKRRAAAPVVVPPRVSTSVHVVVPGDTLSEIAQSHGSPGGWPAVYALNRDQVANPHRIYPGQPLHLP